MFSEVWKCSPHDEHSRLELQILERGGAETVDHLGFLRYPVLYTDPDFVLLQWYVNDVEGHDKSQRPRPVAIPSMLWEYSAFFFLVNHQIVQSQQRLGFVESYRDYLLRRFGDPKSEPSVAADKAFRTFVETCKQRNLPLGVVIFPNWFPSSDFLLDRVIAQCEAQGIQCVDLRAAFAPYQQEERQLWANRLDPHPGPIANALVTNQLIEAFAPTWLNKTDVQISALR